jgi:hypothetical protein
MYILNYQPGNPGASMNIEQTNDRNYSRLKIRKSEGGGSRFPFHNSSCWQQPSILQSLVPPTPRFPPLPPLNSPFPILPSLPPCTECPAPSYACIPIPSSLSSHHGLINYIDTKAKFRHLQKFTCKGTLRQVFICLRFHPSYDPIPPPPIHCILVFCILIHTGKGGGG